jgi:urea transport system permease protein
MGGKRSLGIVACALFLAVLVAGAPHANSDEGKASAQPRPRPAESPPASSSPAVDDAIRRALPQLASKDPAVRLNAIRALVQTHDLRVADILNYCRPGSVRSLYIWKKQVVVGENAAGKGKRVAYFDPLTLQPVVEDGKPLVVPEDDADSLDIPHEDQDAVKAAAEAMELFSTNLNQRYLAVRHAGDRREDELKPALVDMLLPVLEDILKSDSSSRIHHAARESIALVRLKGTFPLGAAVDCAEAARELGELQSLRARPAIAELLRQMDEEAGEGKPVDAAARDVYRKALRQIDRHETWVGVFDCLKNGLSSGSILVLMALGLAITFGTMGVINMAHGELMMVGAITTYSMQLLFMKCIVKGYIPERYFDWYYVASLPASFLVAGLCGFLIERLVVRHLYGRPLETLLATFGVSWILIKSVQNIYGENIGVNAPTWLQGSVEVLPDMEVPYSRAFVILLCTFSVLMFYLIKNYTKLGLRMRATTQNREMASALGVNTRWVDGCTFALGSGLAGIAGYGMTVIGGVSPGMGQTYIVESFLVVVTGGVGELAGTVYAGLGLGVLNKVLEPWFGAVWGQVLVLVAIVIFLQRRPAGLFPPKGRQADV